MARRKPARIINPAKAGASNKLPKSLTASGKRLNRQDSDELHRLRQPWQQAAYAYYDQIGEINYAAQFYARGLAPLRLFPALKGDRNEPEETDDKTAVELLDRVQDPGGGRAGMLASFGRLMFLAGECYLLSTKDKDNEIEQWEIVSTDELKFEGKRILRLRAPSLNPEEYEEPDDDSFEPLDDREAVAYRFWKRHPRFSRLPDSPMRGVLEICEELLTLTRAVRARARSRIASGGGGILLLNENVTLPGLEPGAEEDPENDPLMRVIIDALTTAIADEGSASAVAPILIRVQADNLDNVLKHIQLVDPMQLYPETGLREECIRRLALGLDMPPEALLGITKSNHWNAWLVDDQVWKGHLQPVTQQFCDDLGGNYFRPALKEAKVPNWQEYVVGYDATDVINNPDRTNDAKDLYDRRAIGGITLRRDAGYTEDDRPTQEEHDEMLAIALHDASLVAADDTGPVEGSPPTEAPLEATPTAPADPAAASPSSNGTPLLAARILGAAELAFYRARELAGTRLRDYAKRDPEASKLIDGVANRDVPATLGPERAKGLRAPDAATLVKGGATLLGETLRMWAVVDRDRELLCERFEEHVARTLYTERPVPIPPLLVSYARTLESV